VTKKGGLIFRLGFGKIIIMTKPKVILELEFDDSKLPENWEKYLEEFFQNLDNTMIAFGGESRKVVKIKKIKIEYNKNKEKKSRFFF